MYAKPYLSLWCSNAFKANHVYSVRHNRNSQMWSTACRVSNIETVLTRQIYTYIWMRIICAGYVCSSRPIQNDALTSWALVVLRLVTLFIHTNGYATRFRIFVRKAVTNECVDIKFVLIYIYSEVQSNRHRCVNDESWNDANKIVCRNLLHVSSSMRLSRGDITAKLAADFESSQSVRCYLHGML